MSEYKPYKIYLALHAESNEGGLWLYDNKKISRRIVKVKNKENKKFIFCEARTIDKNFRTYYNCRIIPKEEKRLPKSGDVIVINEWYRCKLGIYQTNGQNKLCINKTPDFFPVRYWYQIRYCLKHPQVVVRLATIISLLSFFLGVVGVVLGGTSIIG